MYNLYNYDDRGLLNMTYINKSTVFTIIAGGYGMIYYKYT